MLFRVILYAMKAFPRITVNPHQMGGLPCIRGLRIPVARVVSMIAEGMGHAQILADYPDLEEEDIREALRYAASAVRERELPVSELP
jgi:uncharacterized protein (DUF433 family)